MPSSVAFLTMHRSRKAMHSALKIYLIQLMKYLPMILIHTPQMIWPWKNPLIQSEKQIFIWRMVNSIRLRICSSELLPESLTVLTYTPSCLNAIQKWTQWPVSKHTWTMLHHLFSLTQSYRRWLKRFTLLPGLTVSTIISRQQLLKRLKSTN